MSRYNVAALAVNALFIVLHLLQMHLWYYGLAQDVQDFTPQWSVILMLVIIVMMQSRRGDVLWQEGSPSAAHCAVSCPQISRLHLLLGGDSHLLVPPDGDDFRSPGCSLYTFLLLLQVFLHVCRLNKWWGFALETTVLASRYVGGDLGGQRACWYMFFFGFAGIVVATTMHGLGLARWVRLSIIGLYLAFALFVYNQSGWRASTKSPGFR